MIRLALAFCLAATPALSQDVTAARYEDPTERYAHGVLGDAIEHGALVMEIEGGRLLRLVLPDRKVFEDTEPRLFDVDGDGEREVIVVESDNRRGARLSVYGPEGLIAATEHIGQAFRWLAPVGVGAADLDGDGAVEIAFVDRPHLAKTLRIFRYRDGQLSEVASLPGVTNHRIGERDIAGGIRDCGDGPEVIVADAAWREILSVTFDGQSLSPLGIGRHDGRDSFARAMACE